MSKIKAIVYDCDGMIVHEERFSRRLEAFHQIPIDRTISFFQNQFQQCLIGKADLKQELLKSKDEWGWQGSVDEILALWFSVEHNKIDDRFKKILEEQKNSGIAVYLATNNEKYRTENLRDVRGLGLWFDDVFSSAALGAKKPDAEFYRLVLDAVGISKDNVLFWDDDQGHVDAARSLGLNAELYTNFEAFQIKMKDYA